MEIPTKKMTLLMPLYRSMERLWGQSIFLHACWQHYGPHVHTFSHHTPNLTYKLGSLCRGLIYTTDPILEGEEWHIGCFNMPTSHSPLEYGSELEEAYLSSEKKIIMYGSQRMKPLKMTGVYICMLNLKKVWNDSLLWKSSQFVNLFLSLLFFSLLCDELQEF